MIPKKLNFTYFLLQPLLSFFYNLYSVSDDPSLGLDEAWDEVLPRMLRWMDKKLYFFELTAYLSRKSILKSQVDIPPIILRCEVEFPPI